MKKEFAVIGLGRFGTSVIKTLVLNNRTVIAVDINEEKVNKIASIVSHAVTIDATDEPSLKDVGILEVDHVLVSIGRDFEASIITSTALLDAGVTNITVKANNLREKIILNRLGIKDVVCPEIQSGYFTAIKIMSASIENFIDLDDNHSIVSFNITGNKICDKRLIELKFPDEFGINVVAIIREGKTIIPKADDVIQLNDQVTVVGSKKGINKFEKYVK